EHHRNCRRLRLCRKGRLRRRRDNQIGAAPDQLRSELGNAFGVRLRPPPVDEDVPALCVPQFSEPLTQPLRDCPWRAGKHTNCRRPCCRLSCERRGEEATRERAEERPSRRHWITSSARSSSDCGIVRPSALAVLRLITNSNFVGCSIGKSAGFAPFSSLSTY